MKRHMARIFKRIEDGVYVKSDSEQLCLEIKDLEARIFGLEGWVDYYRGVCEEQGETIHIHEKGADEQAATERTLRRRIEELETSFDQGTRTLRDLTLQKVEAQR